MIRNKFKATAFVLVAFFLFDGCSPATKPAAQESTVIDLAYQPQPVSSYEAERCKLDLYLPADMAHAPVLIWVHGGNIEKNSKDSLEAVNIGRRMAKEGIATAVISYRLSPEASYPAYVEDVVAATQWIAAHIGDYGGENSSIFLGGHSAGAYLVAMAAMNPDYKLATHVAGVIAISGQMDTHGTVKKERGLPADSSIVSAAAPLFYVSEKVPPFLILYADQDIPGRAAINDRFAKAMSSAGNAVQVEEIANRDHVSIVTSILNETDETSKWMKQFILSHQEK
ncbi:MAG: alpha/beta hydrolase [Bacteroidia bacterium]|nr:alpha/beta hydrolase [Bacteroidia bacterium]